VTRVRLFAIALLAPLLSAQSEPKLVPDVSQREIQIRYSFTGAELLLFGAILYPRGRVPTGQSDIVVVLKGPVQPIVVREKQKVAGIWMNVDNERFRSAPSFYAVASSRPLSELVEERVAGIYELGLRNIQLSPGAGASPEEQRRFESGLIDLMRRRQLYFENPRGVEITEGVLYRARLTIPARVPTGDYTAETFLIRNGDVIAAATRDVRIEKLGFERFVATAAERWSFTYGLFAVAMSLFLGWGAATLFARRA
jgi:uncharacterized protein (TIGR02186 family)